MSKVIVVGGGPAGMFAAIAAAERGHEVVLLEKNEKLGKKLYITGKGRCNITNAGDMDTLFANVMTNPKFLYSAFYDYDNQRVIDFFEENGLATKVERGNRVFPVSDHSSDVIATLQRVLKRTGVMVQLHAEVRQILTGEGAVRGVKLADGSVLEAERVILATGGFSYQTTGSTGDGYRFARELGHTVTQITPSLVPFYVKETCAARMQGLALKNVQVRIRDGKKLLYDEFGEMLFTHFGVSENNETALTTGKHGEVCKVYSVDQHAMIPDVMVMSAKVWNNIAPEDQEIILQCAHDATEWHKEAWDEAVNEAITEAEDMGVEFVYDVDKEAFREATAGMIDEYREEYPGVADLLDRIDGIREEEE